MSIYRDALPRRCGFALKRRSVTHKKNRRILTAVKAASGHRHDICATGVHDGADKGNAMRLDSDIKTDVENELRFVPGLDSSHIAVAVDSGVLTLAGYVGSYGEKAGSCGCGEEG